LDADGDLEVIVGTDDDLAVLDLSGTGETGSMWPTHRGNLQRTGTLASLVSIAPSGELPNHMALAANYPNPFNPSTRIEFSLPTAGAVSLDVLDIRGRIVATLLAKELPQGRHFGIWNGSIQGRPAAAGVYLYRLTTPEGVLVRKMMLLK
jgi:hypothetical protein